MYFSDGGHENVFLAPFGSLPTAYIVRWLKSSKKHSPGFVLVGKDPGLIITEKEQTP